MLTIKATCVSDGTSLKKFRFTSGYRWEKYSVFSFKMYKSYEKKIFSIKFTRKLPNSSIIFEKKDDFLLSPGLTVLFIRSCFMDLIMKWFILFLSIAWYDWCEFRIFIFVLYSNDKLLHISWYLISLCKGLFDTQTLNVGFELILEEIQ